MSARKAVTLKKAAAYRRGDRKTKTQILDELVELTGWHRDYCRAATGNKRPKSGWEKPKIRKLRAPKYSTEIIDALELVWKTMRCPAGKRLAPMLKTVVRAMVSDGDLDLNETDVELLVEMSAATIDRRLKPIRDSSGKRGKSHTKPGTLLRSQIPIRTWADWDENTPGFLEIDLVGHEGGNPTGEFCFTLTATDIATGWTLNRTIRNKAAIWTVEALDHLIGRFPFPILGIDSDNGSEFINHHLYEYCQDNKITFTRSRPRNSNDGCYVEQKNWTHVRSLVGYLRYDQPAELDLLNEIWELNGQFTNLLCAQQKQIYKERQGSKVIKRYDTARTPVQRLTESGPLPRAVQQKLTRELKQIHPGHLSRQIDTLVEKLETLALSKAPAPRKPRINRAFVNPPKRRKPNEATKNLPGDFDMRQ